MTNKLLPVLMGNPRIDWVWVWVWEIPDLLFQLGMEDGYGDVHIPAIIPVPAIFSFSFKLLKYS